MSAVAKTVLAVATILTVAACAQQPQPGPVVIEPEPTYSGKP